MEKEEVSKYLDVLSVINRIHSYSFTDYSESANEIYKSFKDRAPEMIILTHWITYINDRVKRVKGDRNLAWKKWVEYFGSIILFYYTDKESSDNLISKNCSNNTYYKNFYDFKERIEKFNKTLSPEIKITQKLPQDWLNIIYTLWILKIYFNQNLCYFLDKILKFLEFWEFKEELSEGNYIAYILDLLSYTIALKNEAGQESKISNDKFIILTKFFEQLNQLEKPENIEDILCYSNYWDEWKNKGRFNSKRIMACLRDLIAFEFFKSKFSHLRKEEYPNIFKNGINNWNALKLSNLELPGDRWNDRSPILRQLANEVIKAAKEKNTSKKARLIYDYFKDQSLNSGLISSPGDFHYQPVDLDMTFWYTDQKCLNKRCKECPFGSEGFKCKPENGNCNFNNKIKCIDKDKCPIFNSKGKGFCSIP